jgi:hypothetical protein
MIRDAIACALLAALLVAGLNFTPSNEEATYAHQ